MNRVSGLPELGWAEAMTPQEQPLESVTNPEPYHNYCSLGDCVDVRLNEEVEPPVVEFTKTDDETVWGSVSQADFRTYVLGRKAGQLANHALFAYIGGGLLHKYSHDEVVQFDDDVLDGKYDRAAGLVDTTDAKEALLDELASLDMSKAAA